MEEGGPWQGGGVVELALTSRPRVLCWLLQGAARAGFNHPSRSCFNFLPHSSLTHRMAHTCTDQLLSGSTLATAHGQVDDLNRAEGQA